MSDFHNIYFRISQRIALLIIKKCSENIYANFPPIQLLNFGASLHKIVHFTSTKRNAIEKQFIAFSGTFTVEIIFFGVYAWKNEWMKYFFVRKYVFYWMRKNQFPLPRSVLMLSHFLLATRLLIRNVDLIRQKKWNFYDFSFSWKRDEFFIS